MGIRNIGDLPRNEPGLVDEFLGTSYDVVKKVYENLNVLTGLPSLAVQIAKDQQIIESNLATIDEKVADAATSATNADASAKAAAQSASSASSLSKVYASVGAGLADTTDGQFFAVPDPSGGEVYSTLYQNQGGNAVAINQYPSTKGAWDRKNHTGTQGIDTIDGLAEELATFATTTQLSSVMAFMKQFNNVMLSGAKGDGTSDDTAAINTALANGLAYFPDGDYLITDPTILTNGNTFGSGRLLYNGSYFPAGDITGYTPLLVPSVFPTIQAALDYAQNKHYRGPSGFCSIQIAKGTYGSLAAPLKSHIITMPDGYMRLEIVGATGTKEDVTLYCDTSSNQSAFLVHEGNSLYKLASLSIIGVNGWISHGKWQDQVYGGGVWCEGSGSRVDNIINVSITKFYYGVRANLGAFISCDASVIVTEAGDVGVHAAFGSTISCNGMTSNNNADGTGLGFGFMAEIGSAIHAENVTASGNNMSGIVSQAGSSMWAQNSKSTNNGSHGYFANLGFLSCENTTAQGNGGYGHYSHGTGGSMGANSAVSNSNQKGGFYADYGGWIDVTVAKATANQGHGFAARFTGSISGDAIVSNSNKLCGVYAGYNGVITSSYASSNGNGQYAFKAEFGGCLNIKNWGSDDTNVAGKLFPSTPTTDDPLVYTGTSFGIINLNDVT